MLGLFKKLRATVIIFDKYGEKMLRYKWQLPKGISIRGGDKSNIVRIHKSVLARNVKIFFVHTAYNCKCVLDDSQQSCGLDIDVKFLSGQNSELFIGKNTEMNGTKIWLGNGSKCHIGNNCLISYETIIRTTDGHTILDCATDKILNNQKNDCIISDDCWIGLRTIINKNVQLPMFTIVGSGSVVTGQFRESNTIIAGNPARVIKTNVKFDRCTIYDYLNM